MRILMINKFLYPKGGAEAYMLRFGKWLEECGNTVEYFGMFDERNTVGNSEGLYTKNMDFHGGSRLEQAKCALPVIRSEESYRKLRTLVRSFRPDMAQINNINYQLTPSVIEALRDEGIPMVMTVHDSQIVCPAHLLYCDSKKSICEKCLHGSRISCITQKCIHGSYVKSLLGAIENSYWEKNGIYDSVSLFICPSRFMEKVIRRSPCVYGKTAVLKNFAEKCNSVVPAKERSGYLYFGRLSYEKGIDQVLDAAKRLPNVSFTIAGSGPMEEEVVSAVKRMSNIRFLGFIEGEALSDAIGHARFTLSPSVCHENCSLSIMESIGMGTPVISSNTGGSPELIKEGKTGLIIDKKEGLSEAIADAEGIGRNAYSGMVDACASDEGMSVEEYGREYFALLKKKGIIPFELS